jgi:hypothetical protein
MAERIKIITVAMAGMRGTGIFYLLDKTHSTATRISHLLPVVDSYARLAVSRIFEIAFRLYSLPV